MTEDRLAKEQRDRVDRMRSQPLYVIDVREVVPSKKYAIAVSGSTANLYTVTLDATMTTTKCAITCSCPDGIMAAKFKRIKCKHACFVLLRLLAMPLSSLNEGGLDRERVLTAAARAHTIRNWESLTNLEYQREYERLSSSPTPPATSHLDVTEAALREECSICLEAHATTTTTTAVQCVVCRKAFHRECIDVWLRCTSKKFCPLCRGSWEKYNVAAKKKNNNSSAVSSSYKNLGGGGGGF